MIVYRLQKAKHGRDISGIGSTFVEGRWHLTGSLPLLYTASSRSLSILEALAHLPNSLRHVPKLTMLEISIPDTAIVDIPVASLPTGWRNREYQVDVQQWGMNWLRSKSSLAIKVPSYISLDSNVLVNPLHDDFKKVKLIEEYPGFLIDDRLL